MNRDQFALLISTPAGRSVDVPFFEVRWQVYGGCFRGGSSALDAPVATVIKGDLVMVVVLSPI